MAYKARPVRNLPTDEEKLAKVRENVASRESTPSQPSKFYSALKEYIESPARVENIRDRGLPVVKRLDLQQKKEERQEKNAPVDSAQIKKDRADKALADFEEKADFDAASAHERKRWEAERKRLKQEAERAAAEVASRQNDKILQQDTADIEAMTEEERQALEQYAVNRVRDQNLPVELAGSPFMKTAAQESAGLIGKIGKQRADELAETFMRQENAKLAQQVEGKARQLADEHGVLASAATIPVTAVSGLIGSVGQLQGAARRTGRYQTLDPNATGTIGDTFTGAVRGQVQKNIEGENPNLLRKAASIGYQGIMSAADSIARAYLGGGAWGGAALAATGSFSQTMADASRQGATPAQAALLATSTAAIEALSEKIPLDNLIKHASGGKQPVKTILKNALIQAGIEATTEEISLVGSLLAEAAILREKSNYEQTVMVNIMQGKSATEARNAAAMDVWKEALNTALVSMVSGGVSSAGAGIAGNVQNSSEANPTAQTAPKGAEDIKRQVLEKVRETDSKQKQEGANPVPNLPAKAQEPKSEATTHKPLPEKQTQLKQDESKVAGIRDVVSFLQSGKADRKTLGERAASHRNWYESIQANKPYGEAYTDEETAQLSMHSFLESAYRSAAKDPNGTLKMYSSILADIDAGTNMENTRYDKNGKTVLTEPVKDKNTQLTEQPTEAQQDSVPHEDTHTDVQTRASNVQEQSAEGGQKIEGIKGTGAAEANFSGKAAYQDLLTDENTQRDRPGDVRPMEVPKTDGFGRRVSETVANAYGAEITTDKMANAIEEMVQEGALGFDVRHNQDSLNTAAAEIQNKGVAATKKRITNAVANGKIKDGDVEQAILLYAMYNSKDTPSAIDNASEILVDLATMANITGRNLQMFRMLRQLTPEGQVSTIRKTVQRNIDSMIQSGAVKKGYATEIDAELLGEYRKAAQENMRAVTEEQKKSSEAKMKTIMDAIYAMEAAKMPSTFKAKWDAWRYMAMLGNAKTQVRNLAGNAAFMPYKAAKDKMASVFERALPKDQRTKAVFVDRELMSWAKEDAKSDTVHDALKYSAKLGDDLNRAKLRENMKVFDTKALERVRKFVEKVPQAGDMLFKNGYYEHSLAGFLKARGYKAADIQSGNVSEAVLSEARSYAIQEAMKATFNDSNAFSDFMATGLRYKGDNPIGKALNIAAEGVLPFRRTPANIVVRFTEYSPVGLAKGAWDMATKVRNGDISAAAAIDQISAGMTGTAVMALGYFLASGIAGVKITGSGTDEDEKRQGHQDYALEFSIDGQDYSYKIDWAAPANLPLFVGANIKRMMEEAGAETDVSKFTSILHGMGTMFEPMLALSCMSSLNDLVEGIRYAAEGEALYSAAADIATSYFTQGIPALARQAAQAMQKNKQTTFANSADPTIRDLQKTAANIPFVGAKYRTDKVNDWGEKETTESAAERVVNAFVNPGTLKKINNDPLEQEITRLNEAQGDSVSPPTAAKTISYTDKDGNFYKNVRLTEEQYQTFATTQGQTAKEILTAMISSADYKAMTDSQKADAIRKVYSYAREKAEQAAFPDSAGYSATWMSDLKKGSEAETILRRAAGADVKTAMSGLDSAWDNGFSSDVTKAKSRELQNAYDSYSKMSPAAKAQVREDASGTAAKYIEAREKGISHDAFIRAAENISKAKGTGTNGNVREIDRRAAIARTTGLSENQVDTLMKCYMEDYDPNDPGSEKTELKYNYIRQEMGLSPQQYADTYRAHLDNSKKPDKIAAIMDLGYDKQTATKLYNIYASNSKGKKLYMTFYEENGA